MPYSPEHKAKTRARIIESARILFNRRGFAEVTIDEIMGEAGLTRGGFYKHFATKDELYAEAVRSFTTCNPFARSVAASPKIPEPKALARRLVNLYLSDEVAADVDQHCPLYALPSDVAALGPRAARGLHRRDRSMAPSIDARSRRTIATRPARRSSSSRSASEAWCSRARRTTRCSRDRSARPHAAKRSRSSTATRPTRRPLRRPNRSDDYIILDSLRVDPQDRAMFASGGEPLARRGDGSIRRYSVPAASPPRGPDDEVDHA